MSPICVDLCRARGVSRADVFDVMQLDSEVPFGRFDTLFFGMQTIGVAGGVETLEIGCSSRSRRLPRARRPDSWRIRASCAKRGREDALRRGRRPSRRDRARDALSRLAGRALPVALHRRTRPSPMWRSWRGLPMRGRRPGRGRGVPGAAARERTRPGRDLVRRWIERRRELEVRAPMAPGGELVAGPPGCRSSSTGSSRTARRSRSALRAGRAGRSTCSRAGVVYFARCPACNERFGGHARGSSTHLGRASPATRAASRCSS